MLVIRPEHRYSVANFEEDGSPEQIIQFIEKEPTSEGSATLRTVHNGTTNEELIKVLIDRITGLGLKFPCIENQLTVSALQQALYWQETRTANRQKRNVEGKHIL